MRAHPIHARRHRRARAVLLVLTVAAVAAGATAARVIAGPPVAADGGTTDTRPGAAPGELDAGLAAQFEAARQAATADGVSLEIISGWRSAAEQQVLVDQAVAELGLEEAHRQVMPPERSAHVQGDAIDVGKTEGVYWLVEHGAAFGLCQVYLNEVWHFELRTEPGGACPAMLPDASSAWDKTLDR